MKKLLLIICTLLLVIGCLPEGDDFATPMQAQLVVIPETTTVGVGDSISFDIWLLDQVVEADLYIDEEKVAGTKQVFLQSGTHQVFAQMTGALNSDTLTILVQGGGKLSLEPSQPVIIVGDTVTFKVLSDEEPVQDADIFVGEEKLKEDKYIFDEIGAFEVFAKKTGFETSDTLLLSVLDQPQIELSASALEVAVGETVSFGFVLGGEPLLGVSLYIDEEKASGNSWQFDQVGTYQAYATKEGYKTSDTLEIHVTEQEKLILASSSGGLSDSPQWSQATTFVNYQDTFYVFLWKDQDKEDVDQIPEAEIYVNDVKIKDSTFSYSTEGNYSVYAHKSGYANSDTLSITVGELGEMVVQMEYLSWDASEGVANYDLYVAPNPAMEGEKILADIYVDDEKISNNSGYRTSHTFKPRQEPYLIYAIKEGYKNSDTLKFEITSAPKLSIEASTEDMMEGEKVEFTVKEPFNSHYVDVANPDIYVDDHKINGSEWTATGTGQHLVYAAKDGYENSDTVIITVTAQSQALNVTVVGFEGESASAKAMLWEGSTSQSTTLGNGIATDIYNFHGGVYISGYEIDGQYNPIRAKYWAPFDGEKILENGNSQANSIMVEPIDGGVVVGGSVGDGAVYWIWDDLVDMGNEQGAKMVITDAIWEGNMGEFAVGNTIENGQYAATIWAYGDRWGLAPNVSYSTASALYLDGNDYYVAGSVDGEAVYWKNGDIHYANTQNGMMADPRDMILKDGNVYMAGHFQSNTERHYAAVWINDNMYKLTGDNVHGGANAIAINSDGEIFVAGWVSTSNLLSSKRKAMIWQVDDSGNILNTKELTDGSKNAEANGMIIEN